MAWALALALSPVAQAAGPDYQLEYDYPELTSGEYGTRFSPNDFWRDFGALGAIPSQQGLDYPESYEPALVGYRQGPPAQRVRGSHSRYEFYYRFVANCVSSMSYPCSPDLFGDRFETP